MNAVFLDTVGLLATWNPRDQWHAAASAVFARLLAKPHRLYTTTFIISECGNALSRTNLRPTLERFTAMIAASGWLIHPTEAEWSTAAADFFAGPPGGPGIVDCVSFQVMRRLGLTHAFTNDTHFRAAGFVPLF